MFKVGDKVKTIVSKFTDDEVKHGVVAYVHPLDEVAPYVVDFGSHWGGFMKQQLESDQ
jgi:hypothetical protein